MLSNKLFEILSDMYVLFAKTQNYHWNVEGCNFCSLHALFEGQYKDLYAAIDVLAEIIRTLGEKPNGTLCEYLKATHLKEGDSALSAKKMLEDLLSDHKIVVAALNQALSEAKKLDNEAVASFISDRLATHTKTIWMLESTLKPCEC